MTTSLKAGVIGWPITQSRSPLIHTTWLKEHNINGSYDKYPVKPEELSNFINDLKENGFSGINVTIPHKEAVMSLADAITDDAKAIGAANTLWFEDGKLIAGNTDGFGFITHLKTSAPNWQANAPVMVLGAGGAARAILYALIQQGVPEIRLTNRTIERAQNLASEFGNIIKVIPWEQKDQALQECSLLVNTTSLGMTDKPPLKINIELLPETAVCYDIVYAPLETELLKAARQKDLIAIDGLGMLLHQAVPGFEKWFGIRPQVTKSLYEKIIKDLQPSELKEASC